MANLRPEDLKNLVAFADKFSPDCLEVLAKIAQEQQIEVKGKAIGVKPVWLE